MLQESRLYSFIDQKEGFTLHFLEGQKLIHDLAIIHDIKAQGFKYFRDAILAIQLLISYLKPGEGLGIYIDSEEPYFRLKVEMSDQGRMRTLLLPEDFSLFPKSIKGKCRVVKTLPNEVHPYTSIIDLENVSFQEAINQLLKFSYQLQSKIFLSNQSDQSVLLMKLPSINVNKIQTHYTLSVEDYWNKISPLLESIFSIHTDDYSFIENHFEQHGFIFLGSKEILFKCSCSRERMVQNIWSVINTSGLDQIFASDESSLEIKCDYCKTNYLILKKEFIN